MQIVVDHYLKDLFFLFSSDYKKITLSIHLSLYSTCVSYYLLQHCIMFFDFLLVLILLQCFDDLQIILQLFLYLFLKLL